MSSLKGVVNCYVCFTIISSKVQVMAQTDVDDAVQCSSH